jgi:hypothetical protein
MFGSESLSSLLWFVVFILFAIFYPRIMLAQMIVKLEESARNLEAMSAKSRRIIMKKIGVFSKDLEERIKYFQDFFSIEPSSLDPFGIVKKIDAIYRYTEKRFDDFVNSIGNNKSKEEKQMINFALRASISINMIAKIVRHYVETVKKYRNLQIALILQMQLPMIERLAKSELEGTEAFANGYPIGDSIGPMVAASLMEKQRYITEDVVYDEKEMFGRRVIILKADGPAPHLGRIDDALKKIIEKRKIAKVITIDAGAKLEGEKTGSIAEGVGFAMGGDFQREIIENILLPKKIPLDSIIVKVGIEEAITPMTEEIRKSVPRVIEAIKDSIKRTKGKGDIIIIGVGNSCGIGNTKDSLKNVEEKIKKLSKKPKEKKNRFLGIWNIK